PHRPVQRLPLSLAGELGRQYKSSYAHRTPAFLGADAALPLQALTADRDGTKVPHHRVDKLK
ncbi:hypothetical protein, partial [Streptomyces sp. NPDC057676]|uniref:hypothetical protein n=1 Tax=Streptomyces sp. NPDC057676 TaxID=3346205 RepID=UPI003688E98F